MTNEPCGPLADLLVDYADGELSSAEAEAVAEHLAHCPACRARLERLERSLDLARVVWQESFVVPPSGGRFRLKPALFAGAAALLLVSAIRFLPRQPGPEVVPLSREAVVEPVDHADFEKLLAREVQAARLAASADLLASHSAVASYQRDALAYLASAYPDTEPGRLAARRANPSTEQSP